ncbi:efflux transporter outer membrane subunit [Anditalea andensis]|uniref:Membrane protein n=1 Tax=Anditalea andensis TaxID=1048983 RepID=A0A074LDS3_9BACT|nr:efflux transporter outer membrane subunit [Anditalea andensis]KEO71947.1 membrane protein [Anditalea andensis]
MRLIKYIFPLTVAIFILAGCKSSRELTDNKVLTLPEYYETADTLPSIAGKDWRMFFDDPFLHRLIDTAFVHNQDLQKTLENINISRARLKAAKLGQLPDISAVAGAGVRRFGDYTMDGIGNTDTNLSETLPVDKRLPNPYTDIIIGAEFNWEIDIWGRYANQRRAAAARFMASQEMANHIRSWLLAEVAFQYYELISLDREIEVLENNIKYQSMAFELSKDLKNSGKENQLAVDQFEAQLLNSKALLIFKKREIRTVELNISELMGVYPDKIERGNIAKADRLPEIMEIGVPADLLRYRPDIRNAEKELIVNKADVEAARAAFFPSFRLSGMAGFNAFNFARLFLNPASSVYQLGAGLTAPLFNRGQIRAAYESAGASQRIAYLDYEQTVLQSYLEVLDMVNVYTTLEEQLVLKEQEVAVQKRSVENSNTMFSVGYANYLEVINSQSRALMAELEYIELKRDQLQSVVSLYRSLGGGWL